MNCQQSVMVPLVVLLVAGAVLALPQVQQQSPSAIYSLIQEYNFNTEAAQEDLLNSLRPNRIPQTVDCLLRTQPEGTQCDPRTDNLRRVVQVLSENNYQCDNCPLELRFFIVLVQQAMRSDPAQCTRLESGLQLKAFCNN